MKLWGGRFSKDTAKAVERFNASIDFDRHLYKHDIRGSVAHCRMLSKQGIIPREEAEAIIAGLHEISHEIETGQFPFSIELEDIHMHVEARLRDKIGDIAGKLHTARSRNDQVALDVRMYTREATLRMVDVIVNLQRVLTALAGQYIYVVLPGYTHLQRAQPVLLAHHFLAYAEMLQRDAERFQDSYRRCDEMPLGAAALAGTPFDIDREAVARELGFSRVSRNSIDAVADRDFILEPLADIAILFAHVSRLAGEIVLWATSEYGFVRLDDAYSTGSSMMPQKKNPDIAELVRGKSGRVFGNLVSLLTTAKGLPLAYNSDLQEDKEPLFDSVDTAVSSLTILAAMLRSLTFDEDAMRRAASDSFLLATDIAEILVARGVPFRQAHEVVGRIVRHCLEQRIEITSLTSAELERFSPALGGAADRKARATVASLLTLDQSVTRRLSYGGTSGTLVTRRVTALAKKHGLAAKVRRR